MKTKNNDVIFDKKVLASFVMISIVETTIKKVCDSLSPWKVTYHYYLSFAVVIRGDGGAFSLHFITVDFLLMNLKHSHLF